MTPQDIINRALRLIGAISQGEAAEADDTANALEALNGLLASWSLERLNIYRIAENTLPLSAGVGSYTVGPGGALNIPRPDRLASAFVRDVNGMDIPLSVIDKPAYDAIPDKALPGTYPDRIWLDPATPLATLHLWPLPGANLTLHLSTWQALAGVALADTLVLPDGYERALAYNLALELAPEYGAPVSALVVKTAAESLAAVKRRNMPLMIAQIEPAMIARHAYNIYQD